MNIFEFVQLLEQDIINTPVIGLLEIALLYSERERFCQLGYNFVSSGVKALPMRKDPNRLAAVYTASVLCNKQDILTAYAGKHPFFKEPFYAYHIDSWVEVEPIDKVVLTTRKITL